jgi:hypothetical protein
VGLPLGEVVLFKSLALVGQIYTPPDPAFKDYNDGRKPVSNALVRYIKN